MTYEIYLLVPAIYDSFTRSLHSLVIHWCQSFIYLICHWYVTYSIHTWDRNICIQYIYSSYVSPIQKWYILQCVHYTYHFLWVLKSTAKKSRGEKERNQNKNYMYIHINHGKTYLHYIMSYCDFVLTFMVLCSTTYWSRCFSYNVIDCFPRTSIPSRKSMLLLAMYTFSISYVNLTKNNWIMKI